MMPAHARRIGKAMALLGSPEDGEALAAARAIGRTLEAAGEDWNDLAATVIAGLISKGRPAFTFAGMGARASRKQMAHLARQPGTTDAERHRLERLRERLLGARTLRLSGEEIEWLDHLWRRVHGEG